VTVTVALFRGVRDNRPKAAAWSLPAMVYALTGPPAVRKTRDHALAWSPATYSQPRRLAANVTSVCAVVLDYDDGQTLDDASAAWSDYPHLIHTSWSHTEAHHKFRLILPMADPVETERWEAVWTAAASRFPGADPACKDPNRLYYLPVVRHEEWPYRTVEHTTPAMGLLDMSHIKAPPKKKRAPLRAPKALGQKDYDRELRRRLREEPQVRAAVGLEIGGSLRGEGSKARIVGVMCPNCQRPDVWWPVEPTTAGAARCNHLGNCGWWGWLEELL
jgi:hypothetical protein